MEIIGNQPESKIDPIVKNELGPENFKNITKLNDALETEAKEKQIEAHLMLVGGMVKSEKRGKEHKDIDLVFYSPQLASETIPKDECPKFAVFASFICDVAKKLNWETKIEKPWFNDYESCGDGKVILYTDNKPIEILPVREDRISKSFEDWKKNERNPYVTLF